MSDRTWFITGVSSGFGLELATQVLSAEAGLPAPFVDLIRLLNYEAQYGDRFWSAHLDVTDTAEVRQVVGAAFAELGRIDVVVNNAGYGLFGAAEELSDEQIRHQLDTNLVGSIQVVRAALPHLRAQRAGRIMQVSSYGGQATNPGASLYNASKWGVEGFVEATAQDVSGFGIGVTIVEPGRAATGFRSEGSQLGVPMEAYDGTPASLARGIKTSTHPAPGDPAKIAAAMIESVDQDPAPLRLTLGSDAYGYIHAALSDRLAALEQQKQLAFSTDVTAGSVTIRGAAVVTGGTSGIGLAIAHELADAGYRVAVFGAHNETAGRDAATGLGTAHRYVHCDVSNEAQVADAMREVADEIGPVEVLVNNAGIGSLDSADDATDETWETLFGVDLKGMWLCTNHSLPLMRQLGGGSIVNISSIHAHLTRRGTFPYAAAKSGVLGLTRSLALELADDHVRVNAVCPGYVRTPPMIAQYDARPDPDAAWGQLFAAHPLGRIGEPQEIAAVVAFLASSRASFVTGASWNVDGGLSARFAT